ncbi:MAG: 3'(2'),5'-bisphosphate nucleotidase CysQ [Bacteroidetes bacterium]|nr:3'(2'),5'-bisphosphate nucleotidase CysQ [Bacteroidota bacterium]
MNKLLSIAISASIKAGMEILKIYNTDFEVEYKKDESPLTLADKNAHDVIMTFLKETGIPVLSEEGRTIPYEERKNWSTLWIVDPLDGTKEFVKKNDEFTVNIALIKNHLPIMGVVYAPVLDELYFGNNESGSFKINNASQYIDNFPELMNNAQKLPIVKSKQFFGIVASRSHLTQETTNYIDKLKKEHKNIKLVSKGSSLKICLVAEGVADIYPRFAPTMEWDTAAGHAVVLSAGGRIVQANSPDDEVVYNKENLLNPWFIVKLGVME